MSASPTLSCSTLGYAAPGPRGKEWGSSDAGPDAPGVAQDIPRTNVPLLLLSIHVTDFRDNEIGQKPPGIASPAPVLPLAAAGPG